MVFNKETQGYLKKAGWFESRNVKHLYEDIVEVIIILNS